uniref:hypothetical protein n=1 Tax=Cephaloticoccus sp. TaxID=1985742 RepID=UPI00404B2791
YPSPAIGYLIDENARSIVVDAAKAPLVRKAFELYATGNFALHEVRNRPKSDGDESSYTTHPVITYPGSVPSRY